MMNGTSDSTNGLDSRYNRRPDRRFGDEHLLYMMYRCRLGRVSRQILASEVGIGEGSARTAIAELVALGLADTARKGMGLTDKGNELLNSLGIEVPVLQPESLVAGRYNFAAIIRDGARLMTERISTRDAAMKVGCEGCIPFRITHGEINSPFYDFMGYDYPDIESAARAFEMRDGDAAVVCGASDPPHATISVFAALLDLLKHSSVEIPWI